MGDKTSKQKISGRQAAIKSYRRANVLETFKDLAGGTVKTLGNDVVKETGAEFMRQLFGLSARTKASGTLERGQSIEIDKALTGEYQKEQKEKAQVRFERRLLEEQRAEIEHKNSELQLQLHAITKEIKNITKVAPKLAQEVQVAKLISGNSPDIYHLVFLTKILEFLKDFRKKIENASIWLAANNKRADKRNFWNQYKVQKGTALLNPETYLQRSAG